MFPFLTVFIIFLLVTYVRREMLRKRQREREEAFWAREEEAQHVPPKNLSDLEYVHLPLEELPIGVFDDDDLMLIEDEICSLSKQRILNINGKTNTDIKLLYGTANFDAVCAMGENFDRLVMLLCDYAKELILKDKKKEAAAVLEYGVRIGSDISANYTLLGECYLSLERTEDLEKLKSYVAESTLPLRQKITDELEAL